MRKGKRGQIWISAVLYVLIAVVVLVLVLEAGLPMINGIRDKSAFNRARDIMTDLDHQVQDIAGEGQGSKRVLPIEISKGELSVENEKLRWKMETESKIIDPGSRIDMGNIVIAADVDVSAYERGSFYIIQNSRILVNISKVGLESNWSSIDTSTLINYIKFKDSNAITNGTFNFIVNESVSSMTGTGYTELDETGDGLTTALVIAHVNSTDFEYDLKLELESKADFIKAGIENFKVK
ncbi:MAG: hypothetical protein GY861_04460 [bacterium]|nr:hypothetical protein [bacterium]